MNGTVSLLFVRWRATEDDEAPVGCHPRRPERIPSHVRGKIISFDSAASIRIIIDV